RIGPIHGTTRQTEARRRHEGLHLDEERSSALDGRDDDASGDAPAALLEEHFRRIGDFAQTVLGHLEDPDLVGRSETVLRRAQDAERVETLALEVEDGVDDVLEDARPRDRALLRDVADEEDRNVLALRELEEPRGALAELRDPAGSGRDLVGVHRLDRVD